MNKKIAVVGLFIMVLMIPAAFAETGVGIVLGEPTGLTIRSGNFPVIGLGWSLASGKSNRIDATVDMWLINDHFIEMLDWYLGVGAKIGIKTNQGNDNSDVFALGVRVPIGIQWWPAKDWELFLEVAPGIALLPSFGFDYAGGIGLRYYF
jgi:hypothetical protein